MSETGFWELAERDPNRLALVNPIGGRHTVGELLAATNRIVHGLRALGLKKGDTVATVLGNETAMTEMTLATAQAGMYLVPINYNLTASEIAYIVGDSESKVVIANGNTVEAVDKAISDAGAKDVVLFSTGDTKDRARPYAELTRGQPDTAPEDRAA